MHGQVAEFRLRVEDEAVAVVGLAGLEPGRHACKRLVVLLGELAELAAERSVQYIARFAANDAEDDLARAAAKAAALVGSLALVGSALSADQGGLCRGLCPRVPDGCFRKLRSAPNGNRQKSLRLQE